MNTDTPSSSTPPPWTVDSSETLIVRAPDGGIIAQIGHLRGKHGVEGRRDSRETHGNAALIAAAPDLLKACRQAIYALNGREHDGFLRDAIERATGVRP